MGNNRKTLAEVIAGAKTADPDEIQTVICREIVAMMPDEVKAHAATNPEAVKLAVNASLALANDLGMQLMLLLITKPSANHECKFSVGSLAGLCKDNGGIPIRLNEPAESKSNPIGFRPTQAAAKA